MSPLRLSVPPLGHGKRIIAAKVARLCMLREDFLLEMTGVYTEKIKQLDGLSEEWRKLYFIRNLVRTLREIESGIHMLMSDPQFKVLLAAQEPERQKAKRVC